MISPKYDPNYIENELRNSRRLVEKSIEFSRRYTPTDSHFQDRFQELIEKLRNEEYLKISYERALKDNVLLFKQEQKKNIALEQKVEELEQRVLELSDSRYNKIISRIEMLENNLKRSNQSTFETGEKPKKPSRGSMSLIENSRVDLTDSERLGNLQRKLDSLERVVKSKRPLKGVPSKSKSFKVLPKKKSTKSPT